MDLVKKTSAENKGKSLGEILQIAKKQYKPANKTLHNKVNNKTRNRKPMNFRKSRAKR